MTANAEQPMTAIERRNQIAQLVDDDERVFVAELAQRFNVTDVSIRRDLAVLEDAGRVRRVHGGAVGTAAVGRRRTYLQRARDNRELKERIGHAAATLIAPGDVVVFDSGTTVARVAASVAAPLRRTAAITVVTNSLPVIEEVSRWVNPHLVCLGGLYLPGHEALVGPQTILQLRELSADIVFVGCDGWTHDTGLTTPHVLVAEVGGEMVGRARKVIAVTDSTKIGRRGFTPIAPLSAVNVLVTDDAADPDELKRARDSGIEVIIT